ncbi:MAG: hypothetical protein WC249_02985 [Patescibacteria group bacterium]|jgi:hypothetical protein
MNFVILENIDSILIGLISSLFPLLRPLGACREGEFSSFETNLPFTGEVKGGEIEREADEVSSEIKNWSYDQFNLGKISYKTWIEYESCTHSKLLIHSTLFGVLIGLENIGPNTTEKIAEVFLSAIKKLEHRDTQVRVAQQLSDLLEKSKR